MIDTQAPVLLVPNAISDSVRKELLALWKNGHQFDGTLGSGGVKTVNKKVKNRVDVDIFEDAWLQKLDDSFSKTIFAEIRKAFHLDVTWRKPYRLSCYKGEDKGLYLPHRDTGVITSNHYRYSMSLLLSDDYEGGHLYFPEYNAYYKPEAGTAIVFPSTLLHGVSPVLSGDRFILMSFLHGDAEEAYRRHIATQVGMDAQADLYRIRTQNHYTGVKADIAYPHSIPVVAPSPSPVATAPVAEAPKIITPVTSIAHPKRHGDLAFDEQLLANGQVRKLTMRKNLPEGVLIFEDYLEPELCRALADYADSRVYTKLNVVDFEKSDKSKVVTAPSQGRVTDHVDIDGMSGEILSIFNDVYCNRLSPFYKANFEWYERPQILRYPAGGKYNQHADSDHWVADKKKWVRSQDRDYSVLLYLNEEYEGGELEFVNQKYKFKPKTGMLVGFPSDHRYLHAALPTTSGIRYVIVSWAAIIGSPRVRQLPPYASVFVRQKRF